MAELRLRDDQGHFVSDADESNYMNSIFRGMCGLQPATEPTPAPTTPANSGQPVPPGAGPEPLDEHKIMNRALLILAGGIPSDSR
jgi:hypothetical protein